jgi:seryl-tRNA synthetase
MVDIIKRGIVDLDPEKVNYGDNEEIMEKINELEEINKKLLRKKFKLQRKKKRLENKLTRLTKNQEQD